MKCGLSPCSSPVVTCILVPEIRLEPAQARIIFALRAHTATEKMNLSVGRWERRDLLMKLARGHFSVIPQGPELHQGNSADWDTAGLDTFLRDSPGATNVILMAFIIDSCTHPIAAA